MNEPQIRNKVRIETTLATRLGVTALSSPKVTVFSEVKSRRVLWTRNLVAMKLPTKIAT